MSESAESKLLELIAEVQGLLDLAELREGLLRALARQVPFDWASLNDIGSDPAQTVVLNRPPLARRWHARFAELAHENPLLARWLETRDGRAYRFSDVAEPGELERLALFREVYGPLGVRHQIAFTLPSSRDRVLAVALSRREVDFNDEERDFLNVARPYLIQVYRNALAFGSAAGPRQRGSLRVLLAGEGLTKRQTQVVLALAHGASSRSIAGQLGISERTVQKHLEHAFAVLGVSSRDQAAARVWSLAGGVYDKST